MRMTLSASHSIVGILITWYTTIKLTSFLLFHATLLLALIKKMRLLY
ncbi:hypothetical protein MTR67_003648 [Solanum verrucosum]|uniref:Uncharacterized protein n=1 Tax=Solanum verrucosum TaxID=315347 RepID=A0AAF0PSW2_SOLVR|nr:hypothetical protein MTR67_003648 [Solanum verrucosum]